MVDLHRTKKSFVQNGVMDNAAMLSELVGAPDSSPALFLHLSKLGISGAGLIEVPSVFTFQSFPVISHPGVPAGISGASLVQKRSLLPST